MEKIAVIGSGIAGLAAARELARAPGANRVTLFEGGSHFGGHANTVDVTLGGVTHGVDTGFLVYNERTYPRLVKLFGELGVAVARADMSFSVQVPGRGLEWSGRTLGSVFAQRANLLRPTFWRMLADVVRFNRLTTRIAQHDALEQLGSPIGEFLIEHRFSDEFREWYLLPMISCIWSCPTEQMLAFPMATLIRFCHNHGLLQVLDRPQWWTVRGGSREYVSRVVALLPDARLHTPVRRVKRLDAGVLVTTDNGVALFDQVVLACHSNEALQLLGGDATADEARTLGAIRYQPNRAVLHTDESLLPANRSAWAAWNYESGTDSTPDTGSDRVCLHYLLNQLQPLPWQQPVIVSLNPVREPRPSQFIRSFDYAHPVFDDGAIAAQRRLPAIQGQRRTWFCGAWTGYGFHEDGLASGLAVADAMSRAEPVAWRGAA
jgi:predicted NAD/FAD-binding protein